MSLANKPAYPAQPVIMRAGVGDTVLNQGGMTLLEEYTGRVLQGLCANPSIIAANASNGWGLVNCSEEQLSNYAIYLANAAIAELEKVQP